MLGIVHCRSIQKGHIVFVSIAYKVGAYYKPVPWYAVWLQDPLPYFAQYPEADILASSDVAAPTHDDGGLEDPEVMGRQDLNIGLSLPCPALPCPALNIGFSLLLTATHFL